MNSKIRIVAQEVCPSTGNILTENLLHEKEVPFPKTIEQLGYSHQEQILILKEAQDSILKIQSLLIDGHNSHCPQCGKKTKKAGIFKSILNAIFTEHEVKLKRNMCVCGWKNKTSILHIYGSSMHPDLIEMQCFLGAENSFSKAERILEKQCCFKLSINNNDRIQRTILLVGDIISDLKMGKQWPQGPANSASTLIVNVDGGHVKSKDPKKRSFEEMLSIIENPDDCKQDGYHKLWVGSAKNDKQHTIKKLTLNACIKHGMTKNTKVIALCDGAKNCWSIVKHISKKSGDTLEILDWFHIGKKFKNAEHLIPDEYKKLFNKGKWHLWHGRVRTSLIRLEQVKVLLDKDGKAKIDGIMRYIKNNEDYIVNYFSRKLSGLVYTSHIAESSVNALINCRQKRNQQMQWTRKGAHAILQIRTSRASGTWKSDWKAIQKDLFQEVA